jgi:hypothetical protein
MVVCVIVNLSEDFVLNDLVFVRLDNLLRYGCDCVSQVTMLALLLGLENPQEQSDLPGAH